MISLDGKVVLANFYIHGPKSVFVYYNRFLGYICQFLDLMNHTSCVRKMTKKEYISIILCQIQNINDEKIL